MCRTSELPAPAFGEEREDTSKHRENTQTCTDDLKDRAEFHATPSFRQPSDTDVLLE